MLLFLLTILIKTTNTKTINNDKSIFCETLVCDDDIDKPICGIKPEKEGYNIRLFKNECELLKYGCEAERHTEYGITNIEYCEKGLSSHNYEDLEQVNAFVDKTIDCIDYDCTKTNLGDKVCGMQFNGTGYRVTLFKNHCNLLKHNCENKDKYVKTELFICEGLFTDDDNKDVTKTKFTNTENNTEINIDINKENINNLGPKNYKANDNTSSQSDSIDPDSRIKPKNIIIVDTPIFNKNDDIKDSIENFFAATHVFDLPLKEVHSETRRMQMKSAGPVIVFKPWIRIPKNISEDYYHAPTLSSCFHMCPTKCPETYSPVCGRPGNIAREPTLVFKNHCYMDYAQCKMRWENKSPTSISSNYIESSFVFCLGDELNGLQRFLPLIRTLQHMGRLKKKGKFRYIMKNMRFFNHILRRDPKIMG